MARERRWHDEDARCYHRMFLGEVAAGMYYDTIIPSSLFQEKAASIGTVLVLSVLIRSGRMVWLLGAGDGSVLKSSS